MTDGNERILMAIPTEGGLHENTSATATVLAQRPDVAYRTVRGRPADYVRNGIVRMFLRSQCSWLFLLDSDTEPPLDCLDKLLALDVPLATGCYPLIMQNGLRWALSNRDEDRRYRLLEWLPSRDKPFEVDAGGAGCLLIHRDVFDRLGWPWFKWVEREDGSQMSEDIFFFQKCNEAGLRVTAEPQVICNHYKLINITNLMRAKMRKQKGV